MRIEHSGRKIRRQGNSGKIKNKDQEEEGTITTILQTFSSVPTLLPPTLSLPLSTQVSVTYSTFLPSTSLSTSPSASSPSLSATSSTSIFTSQPTIPPADVLAKTSSSPQNTASSTAIPIPVLAIMSIAIPSLFAFIGVIIVRKKIFKKWDTNEQLRRDRRNRGYSNLNQSSTTISKATRTRDLSKRDEGDGGSNKDDIVNPESSSKPLPSPPVETPTSLHTTTYPMPPLRRSSLYNPTLPVAPTAPLPPVPPLPVPVSHPKTTTKQPNDIGTGVKSSIPTLTVVIPPRRKSGSLHDRVVNTMTEQEDAMRISAMLRSIPQPPVVIPTRTDGSGNGESGV